MSQPLQLFAQIERIDEDKRIVEGFCRTTGRVKSDPYDLTFRALKKASTDYREWSNVREMHGATAAGICHDLDFHDAEEKIFIRAEITDDQAWRKVKSKTYKGFSIGGRPTLLRGNEVVEFQWTEISLVDRPADPGATITLFRRDDVPEEAAEAPVPMTAEHAALYADLRRAYPGLPDYAAGDAGPTLPVPDELKTEADRLASSLHYDCGAKGCHGHKQMAAAMRCQQAQMSRAEVHIPDEATDEEAEAIARAESAVVSGAVEVTEPEFTPSTPAADAALTAPDAEELDMTATEITQRLDAMQTALDAAIARMDAAPTETLQRLETATTALTETNEKLSRVEADLASAKDEIKRIGDQPAGDPVVRFTQPLTRDVVQRYGEANIGAENVKKLERFAELQKIAVPSDPKEREALATETLNLQRELKAAALI